MTPLPTLEIDGTGPMDILRGDDDGWRMRCKVLATDSQIRVVHEACLEHREVAVALIGAGLKPRQAPLRFPAVVAEVVFDADRFEAMSMEVVVRPVIPNATGVKPGHVREIIVD